MWAVNIIGGSIAGFALAKHLAEDGWEVRVIEEHERIGYPEHCTGLISDTGVKRARIPWEEVAMNEIYGAQIFSNSGYQLKVERRDPVAYVVSRPGLDNVYARDAKKAGAEIRTGLRLIDAKQPTLFLKHSTGRGEVLKGKYLVGADGPTSMVRSLAGMKAPKDAYFVQGVQGRAKGSFDKRFVQLHFGSSFAKGFFAWVVPESPTSAVIGTAVPLGENISKSFDALLAKFDLKQSDLTGKNGGLIPVGPPMPQVSNGNALLLGDAAFQVKSSTGGGIINSCVAAQLAAKVIAGNHSGHLKSLAEYDKLCREHLNPDLHLHWRVHKFLKALTDAQFDDLIQKANKSKAGEFLSRHGDMDRPTKFWGKISKGPQFWRFAPELVKFALT